MLFSSVPCYVKHVINDATITLDRNNLLGTMALHIRLIVKFLFLDDLFAEERK